MEGENSRGKACGGGKSVQKIKVTLTLYEIFD